MIIKGRHNIVDMIKAEELKDKMNSAVKSKTPFLFAVDYEMEEALFIEHPLNQNTVLWRVGEVSNAIRVVERSNVLKKDADPKKMHFSKSPLEYSTYERKFTTIQEGLKRGDSFLANLTVKTPIETNYTLEEIFHRSNSPYAIMVPERFVCFSPETFVKVQNGVVFSYPMKGTINAELPNARDLLLSDFKEKSEHYTVVDLIRSDVSRVACQVRVDRFRYLDEVKTSSGSIYQASSEISGKLFNCDLGDILFQLLPAGSITGAPKPSTVALIARAEQEKRGFYCGVMGYFDGEQLDSAVLIRFIEEEKCDSSPIPQRYFRSGGGITINSDCRSEYEEVLEKVYLPFQS